MDKINVENEIQKLEDMIKIYKQNNISINTYLPMEISLNMLKNGVIDKLPEIKTQYHIITKKKY